jgi:hypothetical protein
VLTEQAKGATLRNIGLRLHGNGRLTKYLLLYQLRCGCSKVGIANAAVGGLGVE